MAEIAAIDGLVDLWGQTTGDSRIHVAVIDGPVDRGHPAFTGARLGRLTGVWPDEGVAGAKAAHGTAVASVLLGQHGGPVEGVAPGCRGLSVPAFSESRTRTSQLEIARGIELAVEAGAHVINISGGQLSPTGVAEDCLARAVELCVERNVLVVAAAGNDGCFCNHVPAALPSVLVAGALDDSGQPLAMSNWGPAYRRQGVLAPGQNILTAVPGGTTARRTGTSLAAPIVSGIAALLLSLQLKEGRDPDPLGVRAALLDGAIPCVPDDDHESCERFLTGTLSVKGAMSAVAACPTGSPGSVEPAMTDSEETCQCRVEPPATEVVAPPAPVAAQPDPMAAAVGLAEVQLAEAPAPEVRLSDQGGPSRPMLVYALGTLGYDFGTEARRDSFKQLMAPVTIEGTPVPANPYDARQLVDHLRVHASEANALIWTLNLELTPIYAVEPVGPYAADVYALLVRLLTGEVAGEADEDFIERVAVPGRLSGRTVRLFSGQVVPVVEIEQRRGLYGWEVNKLVAAATSVARAQGAAEDAAVSSSLREFLSRIYYDLRNLGATARDRALNFAATNAFQAAQTFASALALGLVLDTIAVEKSPFGRVDSDCWDVKLRFFDPDNSRRAKRVFRFTIDVSDSQPVTLGEVRTWPEA